MAIIGKIRKHSGLAIVLIGVAMVGFLFMSDQKFGCSRSKGKTDVGSVNGEIIPSMEFEAKVEKNLEAQKENGNKDNMTDQENYQVRQSTWDATVKDILMGAEFKELGLTVTEDELFDQVQGKQPHRLILQYFTDPKTGQFYRENVVNIIKNLDKKDKDGKDVLDPRTKKFWFAIENAIYEERRETKYNNLVTKGYYMPKAFLKKEYINQSKALSVLSVSGDIASIPDNTVKLTDADFQKFYDKNKAYFFLDEAYRDIDYVIFDVKPSDKDKLAISKTVTDLYSQFQAEAEKKPVSPAETTPKLPTSKNKNKTPEAVKDANSGKVVSAPSLFFAYNKSDTKYDTGFVKKGVFPAQLDTLLFVAKPGTLIPPFELNNAWYMAHVVDLQERPDSMKGSHILLAFAGTGNEKITRTKEEAKAKIDSLLNVLKKNPKMFVEAVMKYSDYPSAKTDSGDLKWFPDRGDYMPFFTAGMGLKPTEMKVVETKIGYSLFMLTEKAKPVLKVKAAVITKAIVPSNETFKEVNQLARSFAAKSKTPEAFDKAAAENGLQKRSSPNVREMDNYVSGLSSARDMVRWAFGEDTKIGQVSQVFKLNGKYGIAILKGTSQKGQQSLEAVKVRIEPSVKNAKKVEMLAEKMKQAMTGTKDIASLAARLNVKIDTSMITLSGYGRSAISREMDIVGQLFSMKKGELLGPLTGNYGAYVAFIADIMEAPAKDDFTNEKMQQLQNFNQRASGSIYPALQKTAKVTDNRLLFY